jgi:hypothetical protein
MPIEKTRVFRPSLEGAFCIGQSLAGQLGSGTALKCVETSGVPGWTKVDWIIWARTGGLDGHRHRTIGQSYRETS